MKQAGFTLVELLVVMAVSAILGFGVLSIFISMNRSYTTQNSVVDIQAEARNAFFFISRNFREAGLDPLGTADAGVELATATELRITRDANFNGAIEESGLERITFAYDSVRGTVRRGFYEGTAAERWDDMCDHVDSFSFSYLDENGADLGAPGNDAVLLAKVRAIAVAMTLRDNKADGGTFTRTLATSVRSRNL